MKYVSTRGGIDPVSFRQAVMLGQADDGGLLMPENIPDVSAFNDAWRSLDFVQLAEQIAAIYGSGVSQNQWLRIMRDAFSTFSSSEVVPIIDFGDFYVMELFHGPTLAFKDIALQVLGRVFEHLMLDEDSELNILGATSGDTGSAAIASVQGRSRIRIFVLFPEGRTSHLQELQMTSAAGPNVHCIALEGSFDDCQRIMKAIFNDTEFKTRHSLGSINSINWVRLMVQIVYYYYASLRFDEPVTFSVPTGNFGNVLAGIIAKQMGAPIRRFVLGTNENDILTRFFSTGEYRRGPVQETVSPSMDIQVASNLERYLYLTMERDTDAVKHFMQIFIESGQSTIPVEFGEDLDISAVRVDTEQTLGTINDCWNRFEYLMDPHTAVGWAAAESVVGEGPTICLSTAHPAKFPHVIMLATDGIRPTHPSLDRLDESLAHKTVLPAEEASVRDFLESELNSA